MKFFFKLIGILFVLFVAVASWWYINYGDAEWHYKMTVTVETPEGIKTGSAVRSILAGGEPLLPFPEASGAIIFKGEAVVVDLGERGVLFALLGGHNDHRKIATYFPNGKDWEPDMGAQKITLPRKDWPRFVTFEDMNDPKTVRTASYAAKVFGEGVSIKSVTIEMTDEDVTTGILEYLPWLETIGGGYLHGGFSSRGAPLGLHGGAFLRIGR